MRIVRRIPGHILSSLCMFTAAVTFVLHLLHFRQRRHIYLAHSPGSIGSAVALTWRSGLGELLLPDENAAELSHALRPLRFCLDRYNGAIIVDRRAMAEMGQMSDLGPKDESTTALFGNDQRR
jgi:hypothetical protein